MKTQTALQLFQYWNRLREAAPAPCRTQIEPADIREVLSQTFILEAHWQQNDLSFRLAGTAIGTLFGRPLRNTYLRELFSDAQKPIVNRLTRNCYHDKALVVLGLNSTSRGGRETQLELLMLPLQAEKEGHRILGCIAAQTSSFWHGLDPLVESEVQSIRIIDPDREPLFLANRPEVSITPGLAPKEQNLELLDSPLIPRGTKLLVIEGGKTTKVQRS